MRILFGDCVLDSEARELIRGGRAVPVSPKAFQLLELLARARPRALSKAEIHDHLWPDTHVADSSLARLVSEARKAIGDDARDPRLLRTAYGFGYAFSGAATFEAAASTPVAGGGCRVTWGPRDIPLRDGENILGRSDDAVIRIESAKVSRRHARIVVSQDRVMLEDLRSKNGTYLRGRRIEGSAELADGDEICVGPVLLVFRAARVTTSTDTEEMG